MTEAEGYKLLGWAPEGGAPSPFVLPMTNDGGDWTVTECAPCQMTGIARRGAGADTYLCGICGRPFTKVIENY